MDRFYINKPLAINQSLTLDNTEMVHQITKVLRKKQGDIVVLFDGSGFNFEFIIGKMEQNRVIGSIMGRKKSVTEPEIKIHLFQGLLKKDKMEWIFQKGTEIGISEFTPVLCERSVKTGLNFERAEKIIKEAAEQCGGVKLPKLNPITGFEEAVEKTVSRPNTFNIIAHEKELESIHYIFPKQYSENVSLFIGPEGGFSEKEMKRSQYHNFYIASLGPRVLRAETAAIAASFLLIKY